MPPANSYTVDELVARIALKAFTSTASSLTPQQIVDLANDSLRSYIVPLASTLREEWWVGKTDIVVTTDASGSVAVPDSVASTLRTVAWSNGGILTPLTRIEPESSFAYLPASGNLPVGFELRGYTLRVLPVVSGVVLHLTAMLRPPQMVLDDDAAEIASRVGTALTLDAVPLAWQEVGGAPEQVDVVRNTSPFSVVATLDVVSLVGSVLTVSSVSTEAGAALDAGGWVADVGYSPFANVPIELYPLLEQDVVCTIYQGVGDKRLKGAAERKKELEGAARRMMAPRAAGNSRPIVNPNAPGMRNGGYGWGR